MSFETDLELSARRLEGESIERVFAIHAWDAPVRDDTRLAVVLQLADRCVEARWADELGLHHGFHLALRDVRGPDEDRGRVVDLTADWRGRLGRIARATIEWGDARADIRSGFAIGIAIHSDFLRRVDYPRGLMLDLPGGQVAIETRFTNAITIAFRSQPAAYR
jgi:hypothetical protein